MKISLDGAISVLLLQFHEKVPRSGRLFDDIWIDVSPEPSFPEPIVQASKQASTTNTSRTAGEGVEAVRPKPRPQHGAHGQRNRPQVLRQVGGVGWHAVLPTRHPPAHSCQQSCREIARG